MYSDRGYLVNKGRTIQIRVMGNYDTGVQEGWRGVAQHTSEIFPLTPKPTKPYSGKNTPSMLTLFRRKRRQTARDFYEQFCV